MKKIIITGATGMVGVSLTNLALEKGMEILCIVRKNSSRRSNLPDSPNVHILEANLCDLKDIQIDGKWDTFFHLAWDKTYGDSRDDVSIQMENIKYTLDAVRLAYRTGCSVFVGAGSQAEYGPVSIKLTPTTPTFPESGYGIAKLSACLLSRLLCDQLNMRFNWVRIVSAYGSLDHQYTLVSYVISQLLQGKSPELTPCEQIWDFIYEKDVATAFLAVGEHGRKDKIYPLGNGEGKTLKSYMEQIQKLVNPSIPLGFGKHQYYPHQPMFLVADISELQRDTGWKPSYSFTTGIQDILNTTHH